MNLKQIAWGAGILIILAAIFGVWASFTKPVAMPTTETHVLAGVKTPEGDYKYTEEKPYYSITASYPAETGLETEADLKARAAIEQSLTQEIADFKQNTGVEAITADEAKFQGLTADRKYALDLEYKEYSSSASVSYAYTVYADTLGAHPNGYYKTFVFDLQGNQAHLGDLFVASSTAPGYLERIAGIAQAQVKAELTSRLGEAPGESFFSEGVAPKEENFQNFVIDGDKLVLFFPPYQVAAYAAGTFEARIPLSQLQDILAPGVIK